MQITDPERSRAAFVVTVGVVLVAVAATTSPARAAWDQIALFLSLHGKPEPASANVLSEHESEAMDGMAPQSQAELLLERSINHYAGADDQIAARVGPWRGKIKPESAARESLRHGDQFRRPARQGGRDRGGHRGARPRQVCRDRRSPGAGGADGRAGPARQCAVGSGAAREPRRRAGADSGNPARVAPRRERERALLGGRGARVSSAPTTSSSRCSASFTTIRRRRSASARPAASPSRGCSASRSGCRRIPKLLDYAGDFNLDPETRNWVLPGAARHHRPEPAARRLGVAAVVTPPEVCASPAT